jgi:integrase
MAHYDGSVSDGSLERPQRGHRTPKETYEFLKNPVIARWAVTIENESTRYGYAYRLMLVLKQLGMTPEKFLQSLREQPDDTGITIDSLLGSYESKTGATIAIAAIKRFAGFYRVRNFEITLRVKVRRVREKRPFSWDEALKLIADCPMPYREIFTFMLYGAMDENTFSRINFNEKLNGKGAIDEIKEQMSNDKSHVKISLPPRKANLDRFFVLIPKQFIPKLPLVTRSFTKRGGRLIGPQNLQDVWRRAARRVGLYYEGFGPHKLRTAFTSKCADLGIPVIAEWQMGHGGDKYGYDLSGTDESFVIEGPLENGQRKGGLRRLWEGSPLLDRQTVASELSIRDKEIRELNAKMRKQGEQMDALVARLDEYEGKQIGTDLSPEEANRQMKANVAENRRQRGALSYEEERKIIEAESRSGGA